MIFQSIKELEDKNIRLEKERMQANDKENDENKINTFSWTENE